MDSMPLAIKWKRVMTTMTLTPTITIIGGLHFLLLLLIATFN